MDRLSAVLQKYDYSLKLEDITKRVENIIDKHLAENLQKSVYAQLIGHVDLLRLKPMILTKVFPLWLRR